MNKRIGILGGTFDPPHIGHLIIANEVLHHEKMDEIWFMPNQEPPHKIKAGNVSNKNRIEMLQLAIEGHPKFRIETIEMNREGKSYTFDTMKILKEVYPHIDFHFIIGGDMVEYLPKWYKIEELVKFIQFISVNRPQYSNETAYPVRYVDVPAIDISSNLIRERLKNGDTIQYLIKDNVKRYIEENRLYEA